MPSWLLPALKVVLNNLPAIASVAAPAFTRKGASAPGDSQLVQQQIAELQSAATQNAEGVKALAAQLQETLLALQQAAAIAEARLRRAWILCIAATLLSAAAVGAALYVLFAR